MTASGPSASDPSATASGPACAPPGDRPGPPQVDMMASDEMQAWIARLEADERRVTHRNKYLLGAMAAGIVLLVVILGCLYHWTAGSYAALDDVVVTRHPAHQGRVEISFTVTSPGKVYYRRSSGDVEAEVIDYFSSPGDVRRNWSWVYEPGQEIDVEIQYRRGTFLQTTNERFPTAKQADIVILIDTTESMSPSIAALKEKCTTFSERLTRQALDHRFALIGFGDSNEGDWLEKHDLTADVDRFRQSVGALKRYDGGDLPESALDALEEALALELDDAAIRRFYLVTDQAFHEPSRSGATATDVAARLEEERVLLEVFSRRQFEDEYRRLLGRTGKFQEMENFGRVLSEGRILED